jgi:hypothetical protein
VCAEATPHHPELGAANIPDAEYFRNDLAGHAQGPEPAFMASHPCGANDFSQRG